MMNSDHKPWYEKVSIWITIVAGICAILGMSIFGDNGILNYKDTNSENSEDHQSSQYYKPNGNTEEQNLQQSGSQSGKEAYELGMAYAENGDYVKAIMELQKIENNSEYFADAQLILHSAIKEYTSTILADVETYNQSGDFASSISLLRSAKEMIGFSTELSMKLSNTEDLYREDLLKSARQLFESEGYESAIHLLRDGEKILTNDNILLSKISQYENSIPVSFGDLEKRSASGDGYFEGNASANMEESSETDINGNEHSGTHIRFWVFWMNSTAQRTVYVNGKYTNFRGTYFLDRDMDDSAKILLQIYADDVLVYDSGTITRKTEATNFDVDISGAQELQVKVTTLVSDNYDFYVFEPQVYNKIIDN